MYRKIRKFDFNCSMPQQFDIILIRDIDYLWAVLCTCRDKKKPYTISFLSRDNVITPTLNTPTVITPTLITPTIITPTLITPTIITPTIITPTLITPTIITPTLNTSTVTDSLCNSGAFSNPNAVRDCSFNLKGVGSFFSMQRYCF